MPWLLLIAALTLGSCWFFGQGHLKARFDSKKFKTTKEAWNWLNQLVSILVTALIGIAAFIQQDHMIIGRQEVALKEAILEEIRIVRDNVKEELTSKGICKGGVQTVAFLPHQNIQNAASSTLFPNNIKRHLIHLDNLINEYHRWINYADANIFASMKNEQLEAKVAYQQYNFEIASKNVFTQASYLYSCLTTGKPDPGIDKDCD